MNADTASVAEMEEQASEDWSRQRSPSTRFLTRYVGLLATGFLFIHPYYRHSLKRWLWFSLFYVTFIFVYFLVPFARGRMQKISFVLFFLLAFIYLPFDRNAYFLFIYPVSVLAAFVRRTRTFILVLNVVVACLLLETWWLELDWFLSFEGICLATVFGFSTLSFYQQKRANFLLLEARNEIAQLAKVAERERISRDLHDLLGHTLTLIAAKAELASRILSQDPQRAHQEMVEVEQTARKGVAEVREAVAGYRADGLATEITRARGALASAGVHAVASLAPIAFPPEQESVLCLALREAVTNILRHANATHCTIQLASADSHLRFSVEDNGRGGAIREGNGLRGMRERVHGMNGKLFIAEGPDNGTRIVIDLPLQHPATSSDFARVEELLPVRKPSPESTQ